MMRAPVSTIKALFAASGNVCSFPGCAVPVVDESSGAILGEICHIRAFSKGGPRFDVSQTDVDRSSIANLMILCPNHHALIDRDPETYTASVLAEMKRDHERRVAQLLGSVAIGLNDRQAEDVSRQLDTESADFAIVVALPKELSAVLKRFPELALVEPKNSSLRRYFRGTIRTSGGGSYRVVLTQLNSMGNLESASATNDLIRTWNPRFLIVNGIAAGLKKGEQNFGDILASESVFYYELGKVRETGSEIRSRHFSADPLLVGGIHALAAVGWNACTPQLPNFVTAPRLTPKIHVGPIASGDKVVASSEVAQDLLRYQPNLIGLEMESAGVASAAFGAAKHIGFLVLRSVCDFADAEKNDAWQEYAADMAASCLREFLNSRPIPMSEGGWPEVLKPPAKQRNTTDRKTMLDRLCNAFDMEEFKTLCFLLGVDVDELPGDRKSARARELILLFERRDELGILNEAIDGQSG